MITIFCIVIIVSASTPLIALCEMLMKHTETIKKRDCVSASVIKAEVRENLQRKACVSLPTDLKNKCAETPESPACGGELRK